MKLDEMKKKWNEAIFLLYFSSAWIVFILNHNTIPSMIIHSKSVIIHNLDVILNI